MPLFTGTLSDDILYGTEEDDRLVGLDGNDLLDGLGGSDVLVGGAGNDTYVVDGPGDQIVEGEDQGIDVVYTTVDFWLADDDYIELLCARDWFATTPLQLFGNRLVNNIVGNDGNNFIDGGIGGDVMIGRGGDDTYVVDNAFDRIVEDEDGGYDTVYVEVSYRLSEESRIERLSSRDWTSTSALSLIGNSFDTTIFGNAGNNFIDGGAGVDTLIGLGGNDVYVVDHVDDQVIEALNAGTDLIYTSVDYRLVESSAVEILSARDISSTTPLSLTGNRFNNTIQGNEGANIIDGGAGIDVMYGYGGDDTYYVDFGTETIVEAAGGGYDTVLVTGSFNLSSRGAHVEEARMLDPDSTTPSSLGGNDQDNRLIANAGNNVMDGNGGDDYFDGLLGNDNFTGGSGSDTFAYTTALGANNVDRIQDFETGVDRIALDDAIFSALSAGDLAASAFVTGTAAVDADDRIIYSPTTGELFYDADGSGGGQAVLFATLRLQPQIGAEDFFIF